MSAAGVPWGPWPPPWSLLRTPSLGRKGSVQTLCQLQDSAPCPGERQGDPGTPRSSAHAFHLQADAHVRLPAEVGRGGAAGGSARVCKRAPRTWSLVMQGRGAVDRDQARHGEGSGQCHPGQSSWSLFPDWLHVGPVQAREDALARHGLGQEAGGGAAMTAWRSMEKGCQAGVVRAPWQATGML